MPKAIIMGATSGIGYELALLLIEKGWKLGIAGRRSERLEAIREKSPQSIHARTIDVRSPNVALDLQSLIDDLGGMDLYIHCSGIGSQNVQLNGDIEIDIVETNVTGFVRLVDGAFSYFARRNGGHICVISSIAGTKGLGAASAYSASKRFQNTYLDALEQLSIMQGKCMTFTDIRPGFVDTALLDDGKNYPLKMNAGDVAKAIVNGIEKKRRVVVIDWKYWLLVFFWRLVPQCVWKWIPIKSL